MPNEQDRALDLLDHAPGVLGVCDGNAAQGFGERDPYRIPLRIRKQVKLLLDHLRAHLMQSCERELGLRIHPGPSDQHHAISLGAHVVKQRRLPDARLAPKDQNAAAARPDIGQQLTKRRALPLTAPQGPRRRRRHRSSCRHASRESRRPRR
jgi:hypothetical protein